MVVDNTLTLEQAVDLIGPPIRIRRQPYTEERTEIDNFSFTHHSPLFSFEWVFTKKSVVTQEWKAYQQARAEGKYEGLQTIAQASCGVSAIVNEFGIVRGQEEVFSDIVNEYNSVVQEIYLNELQHGSTYGKRGPVHITVQGGRRGILTAAKGPGPGYDLKQMTEEELERRKESIAMWKAMEPSVARIPPRGCGLPRYSIAKTTIVSAQKLPDSFQVLALYLKPEYRHLHPSFP